MKRTFLLILFVLFFTAPASAAVYNWYGVGHSQLSVSVTYDSPSGNDITASDTITAGVFNILEYSDYNDNSDTYETHQNYVGFCIDLDITDGSGWGYLKDDITNYVEAAWLFDTYWNWNNTQEQNAAIQLLIWESIYGDDFDFQIGDASVSGTIDYWYDLWNDSISTYSGAEYQISDLRDYQDMIVKAVPIPGTATLFAFGLLVLGGTKRFRRI